MKHTDIGRLPGGVMPGARLADALLAAIAFLSRLVRRARPWESITPLRLDLTDYKALDEEKGYAAALDRALAES